MHINCSLQWHAFHNIVAFGRGAYEVTDNKQMHEFDEQ